MSKLFQSKIGSPKDLLQLNQQLTKLDIKDIKVIYAFTNKKDLEIFERLRTSTISRQVKIQQDKYLEQSDDQDDEQLVVDTKQFNITSNYAYYFNDITKGIIFKQIYQNDIKILQKNFNCKLNIFNNAIKIESENYDFRSVIQRLKAMQNNILIHRIRNTYRQSIKNSELIKNKLKNNSINLYLGHENNFFWSLKTLINSQVFDQEIKNIETSYCKILKIIDQPKSDRFPFRYLFQLVILGISDKIPRIQKLYQISLQIRSQKKMILIHVSSQQFIKSIENRLMNQIQNLIIFSIKVKLNQKNALKLTNLLRRYYGKYLKFLISNNLIGIVINKKNVSNINLKDFFTVFFNILQKQESTNRIFGIHLYFSHYTNKKYLFQKIQKIDEINSFKIILHSNNISCSLKIFDQDSIDQVNNLINAFIRVCKEKIQTFQIINQNNNISMAQSVQSVQSVQSAMILQRSILSQGISPLEQQERKQQYSMKFNVEIEFGNSNSAPYTIGKRDRKLEQFLKQKLNITVVCKKIILNKDFQWLKLQDTDLYFTNEEFIENNYLKKRITLLKIGHHSNQFKYVVQALTNKLEKNGKIMITPTEGTYIPTHEIIRI